MTSSWIVKHTTVTTPYNLHSQYIEFPSGIENQRMIQLQLVRPNILTSTDSVTVTITFAMDTQVADSGDHDISFGVSDGTFFTGFIAHDKDNYPSTSPCHRIEGSIKNGILHSPNQGSGSLVSVRHYSGEIKIQIRPTEKWGICCTQHDEGFTNVQNFQRALDITNGLYLEVYRQHIDEKYRVKYISVDVDLD